MHIIAGTQQIDCANPIVMGILNVTPDSFFDGGRYEGIERAVARALEMECEGADIIDVGGESSRPGAEPVSPDEEIARVVPVIEALKGAVSLPVSVDTYNSVTAARAIEAGAVIVNDISAMQFDPGMAPLVAEYGVAVILMHMQGSPRTMQEEPQYTDAAAEIHAFLGERGLFAESVGISHDRIIIDPGIGFGKTLEYNLDILQHIDRYHDLGYPLMVGVSRKRMFEALTGALPESRHWGTAAVTAWCVERGVQFHRVHDVAGMRQVCDVTAALMDGTPVKAER